MNRKLQVLLLAGNTLRSRAYAQNLTAINGIDIKGFFFGFNTRQCNTVNLSTETRLFFEYNNIFFPDMGELLATTFQKNSWAYKHIETEDVNSEYILSELKAIQPDIIIFSGYGGQILSDDHFKNGSRYLHMHPGNLPSERGSTTLYYSILGQKNCTVSAFFMTAEIDKGETVIKKSYCIPTSSVDIDNGYDNIIRADCLGYALKLIIDKNHPINFIEDNKEDEEYYIIHPLLKHIAILSLDKSKKYLIE